MERVLLTFPVLYPPLWETHAQMIEAITPVCEVEVMIPASLWGDAIHWYLAQRGIADVTRVRYTVLPTDDMWIRDYGPAVGLNGRGEQVVVHGIFSPLPNYPQDRDAAMSARWAAHEDIPALALDLHIEGGNVWSDGEGTLITTEHVLKANPDLTHAELERRLRQVFAFTKLIVLPLLQHEETGHVDLLMKLASSEVALLTDPKLFYNGSNLNAARLILRQVRNACDRPYTVELLPALPPYLNWGVYPIWRTYTNALTVNGRVLVPTYGVREDEQALRIYERTMPDHTIVPIDCRVTVNGGGAVHCLTREIPAARLR
jgi:agmatine deiminase